MFNRRVHRKQGPFYRAEQYVYKLPSEYHKHLVYADGKKVAVGTLISDLGKACNHRIVAWFEGQSFRVFQHYTYLRLRRGKNADQLRNYDVPGHANGAALLQRLDPLPPEDLALQQLITTETAFSKTLDLEKQLRDKQPKPDCAFVAIDTPTRLSPLLVSSVFAAPVEEGGLIQALPQHFRPLSP